jgi:hypothetical protein
MGKPDEQQPSRPHKAPDTDAFLRWLQTVPDPMERYALATSSLEKYQDAVQQLASLRAGALADATEGESLSELARRLGVSRQRAYQIVSESRSRGRAPSSSKGQDAAERSKSKRAPSAKRRKGKLDQ